MSSPFPTCLKTHKLQIVLNDTRKCSNDQWNVLKCDVLFKRHPMRSRCTILHVYIQQSYPQYSADATEQLLLHILFWLLCLFPKDWLALDRHRMPKNFLLNTQKIWCQHNLFSPHTSVFKLFHRNSINDCRHAVAPYKISKGKQTLSLFVCKCTWSNTIYLMNLMYLHDSYSFWVASTWTNALVSHLLFIVCMCCINIIQWNDLSLSEHLG